MNGEISSALAAGLEALGLPLGVAQRERLLTYLALLGKWNAAYNLTAVRDPAQQLVLHLFDSLAIVRPLAPWLPPGAVVLDVGSGGGLPGVVLAVCRPDVEVHTVDASAKKAAFVTQVRGVLGLANLHAHHARVETMKAGQDLPAVDLIVARAFSSLSEFVRLTAHLRAPGGCWAAMKGQPPQAEIDALPQTVEVRANIALSVPRLDAQRHVLVLTPRAA